MTGKTKSIIIGGVMAALGGTVYVGTESVQPIDSVVQGEIVSARTEYTKAFPAILPGQVTLHIYSAPVHAKAADGKYKTIDTTVQEKAFLNKAISGYDNEIAAVAFNAELKSEKPYNYRFTRDGASVAYEALFDTSKAISIKVEPLTTGMKETIILADESAPTILQWRTNINGTVKETDQGWTVVNNDGQDAFIVQAFKVWDVKQNLVKTTALWEKGILTLSIDAKGAEYPITVDPTTGTQAACNDGYTRNGDAVYDTARNTNPWAAVFTDSVQVSGQNLSGGTTYYLYRYFAGFYFSPTLNVQTVTAASFNFYMITPPDSTFELNMQLSTQRGAPAAAWSDSIRGWQASGDYTPYMGPAYNFGFRMMTGGNYPTNPVSIAFDARLDSLNAAIARADTFRMCLMSLKDIDDHAPTGAGAWYVQFKGSAAAAPQRPYLSVTYTPKVPAGFVMHAASSTSIHCSWTDNISGETGYRIKNAVTGAYIDSVTGSADSTKTITGLDPNKLYDLLVQVIGGTADGAVSAADSCYTRANTPGAITLTFPTKTLGKFILNTNSNPSYTEISIEDSLTGLFVHKVSGANPDTFGAGEDWHTFANWQGAAGDCVSVGVGKKINLKSKARSGQ
jgi:hypothetical protein